MEKLPNLPTSLQYFADIRKSDCIYVDKTEYIYSLCRPPNRPYFLSRPRRFGKSLTLDTISELFSGNRALFEGLWIEDKWDWSETYPVIRMSLDEIRLENGLTEALQEALHDIAKKFKIRLHKTDTGMLFRELIRTVAEKTGKQVVVLIEGYDMPITDAVDPTIAEQNRQILKYFFSPLKMASNRIRFLLITGVYPLLSPELNHLDNITDDVNSYNIVG